MLKDVCKQLSGILSGAGIDDHEYEARLLIEYVTGLSPALQLAHRNDYISDEEIQKLILLAGRRAERYPLQYLIGSWDFMGFELKVGEGVLIPRDDTEVLTRLCIDHLKGSEGKKTIDLCAGSGAVAIALNRYGRAEVTAVELSDKAFNFLLENIKQCRSSVIPFKGDIFECHADFDDGQFDLIASNPPYIKSDEINTLQPEVCFEPRLALDGGADGLDFYRAIIKLWSQKLKKGGAMAFELSEGQAEYVGSLMREAGFTNIKTAKDLGDTDRAIIGTLSDI